MDIVVIDGVKYNVLVTDVEENFNILYNGDNTGRTTGIGARMVLDPLGTFIGHKITLERKQGYEKDFDNLYKKTYQPIRDGIRVKIVHLQSTIEYDAYVSQGSRKVEKIDEKTGKIYWGEFSLNIIPMEAQVLPE